MEVGIFALFLIPWFDKELAKANNHCFSAMKSLLGFGQQKSRTTSPERERLQQMYIAHDDNEAMRFVICTLLTKSPLIWSTLHIAHDTDDLLHKGYGTIPTDRNTASEILMRYELHL